jgi:hypothetical protein
MAFNVFLLRPNMSKKTLRPLRILCALCDTSLFYFRLLTFDFDQKQKTPEEFRGLFVIPLGLEPRAHTLKVYCSTN